MPLHSEDAAWDSPRKSVWAGPYAVDLKHTPWQGEHVWKDG